MKIRGSLVDILLEIWPGVYDDFVVYEGKGKQKILYVQMLMALYGMMIASLLYSYTLLRAHKPVLHTDARFRL